MEEPKDFISWIGIVPDPRIVGMVTYPLGEILLVALVGTLCRMEDWDEIVYFAEEQVDWLRRFLAFANGIASAKTFRTVFRALDHGAFSEAFTAWVSEWGGSGVIAIDGKTLRGSKDGEVGQAQHVLNAFAHESGLVLGHQPVDGKSNEITAIPAFLERLALEGAIVTMDAMGAQKDIARRIVAKKADYILALKGNQGLLHEDARLFLDDPKVLATCLVSSTLDAGHGRIEERTCRATDDIAWLRERHPEWKGLRSIAAVTCARTDKKTGQTTSETRLYITSLPPEAKPILDASRAHWSVENNLHWTLDVTFREDACRYRKDNGALNLSLIRKTAINLIKQDKTCKLPLKRKRLKAAMDPEYRATLIGR